MRKSMIKNRRKLTSESAEQAPTGSEVEPSQEGPAASNLSLAERMAAALSMWEQLQDAERLKLLTVDLTQLQQQAEALDAQNAVSTDDVSTCPTGVDPSQGSMVDQLQTAVTRLQNNQGMRLWSYQDILAHDAESFYSLIREKHVPQHLQQYVPKVDSCGLAATPAAAALQKRMCAVLAQLAEMEQAADGALSSAVASSSSGYMVRIDGTSNADRDLVMQQILIMATALEKEHEDLSARLLGPVASYVRFCLPGRPYKHSRLQLNCKDLQELATEELQQICWWLRHNVERLCNLLGAKGSEAAHTHLHDVEMYTLSSDGTALIPSPQWLQTLQDHHTAQGGGQATVEHAEGLHPLLDWVYGSFVSQADSSRQIAKLQLGRQLGTPKQAHTQLVHSLLKQAKIESHAQEYKLLLQDMLEIRQRYQQLKQRYDIPEAPAATDGALESAVAAEAATDSASRPAWPEALPNEVVIQLLDRELLLASAKLEALQHESRVHCGDLERLAAKKHQVTMGGKLLCNLAVVLTDKISSAQSSPDPSQTVDEQQKQRELALANTRASQQRLKAELHTLDIEFQLAKVQIQYRNAKVETVGASIRELAELREQFQEVHNSPIEGLPDDSSSSSSSGTAAAAGAVAALGQNAQCDSRAVAAAADNEHVRYPEQMEAAGKQLVGQGELDHTHLRQHFHQDILPRLYTESDDKEIFTRVMGALKYAKECLNQGEVVIQYLERDLTDVACDDPSVYITKNLVLPLLQQQIDAAAAAYQAQEPARQAYTGVLVSLGAAAYVLQDAASGSTNHTTAAWQHLGAALDQYEDLKRCQPINQLLQQGPAAVANVLHQCISSSLKLPCAQQDWLVFGRLFLAYINIIEQLDVSCASRSGDQQDLVNLQATLAAVADELWAAAAEECDPSRSKGTAQGLLQKRGLMLASMFLLQLAIHWLQHWPVGSSTDPPESDTAALAAVAVAAADVAAFLVNKVAVFDAAVAAANDAAGLVSSPATITSMETAMTAVKQLQSGLEHNSRAALSVTQLLLLLLDMQLQLQHDDGKPAEHAGSAAAMLAGTSSNSSVSDVLPAAVQGMVWNKKYLQQYHQKVLEYIEGLTEASWQAGYRAVPPAQRSSSAVINTLLLLTRQLQQLSKWYFKLFVDNNAVPHPHDPAVCRLLPSLALLLLHTGASSSGQEDRGLAEAVIGAAVAATGAWAQSLYAQRFMQGYQRDCREQLSLLQEAMPLVSSQIQQAAQSNSTADNSSGDDGSMGLMLPWLEAAGNLQSGVCSMLDDLRELEHEALVSQLPAALVAAEHCFRTAGQALCGIAGSTQCPNGLDAAMGERLAEAAEQLYEASKSLATVAVADSVHGGSSKQHYFTMMVSYTKFAVKLAAVTGSNVQPGLLFDAYLQIKEAMTRGTTWHLATAAPSLLLLARGLIIEARQAAAAVRRLQEEPVKATSGVCASASAAAGADAPGHRGTYGQQSQTHVGREHSLSSVLTSAYQKLWAIDMPIRCALAARAAESQEPHQGQKQQQQQQQQEPRTANTAACMPESAAAIVGPHLAEVRLQLKQQLMLTVTRVAESLTIAKDTSLQAQLVAESRTYGLPLLQQLEAAGEQLCALLPLPLCCNNPRCGNMSLQSELLLVAGKACICAGCEVARYCGVNCQTAHWQAHKMVCRKIRKGRTAAV